MVRANPYKEATFRLVQEILTPIGPRDRALDFGSGDGWFASQFEQCGLSRSVVPVDVLDRPGATRKARLYDGKSLPYADRSFDLVYAIDVLHHCDDPVRSMRDVARCSAAWLLIKDHTYKNRLGRMTLALLDEIGNRRFGVPSLYNYQREWEWFAVLAEAGFELKTLIHPAPCEPRPMLGFVNNFQFVGLWHRSS